jgi:hypothetical protein
MDDLVLTAYGVALLAGRLGRGALFEAGRDPLRSEIRSSRLFSTSILFLQNSVAIQVVGVRVLHVDVQILIRTDQKEFDVDQEGASVSNQAGQFTPGDLTIPHVRLP